MHRKTSSERAKSDSNQTSEKLAARTYPALQEFHQKVNEVMNALDIKPLPNTQSRSKDSISPALRSALISRQLKAMARVLNTLYSSDDSDKDDSRSLTPKARVILHSVTGSAPYFASIFLPRFFDTSFLKHLLNSRSFMDDIYSQFGKYIVSNTHLYTTLSMAWNKIRAEKKELHAIVKDITRDKPWLRVIIHQVSGTKIYATTSATPLANE